jgi:hypothetical protein
MEKKDLFFLSPCSEQLTFMQKVRIQSRMSLKKCHRIFVLAKNVLGKMVLSGECPFKHGLYEIPPSFHPRKKCR